jgi:F-type H+-transporting ATPase subunit b
LLNRTSVWALGAVVSLTLAMPVLAAEEGGPDIFAGGIGNALVTLIVFGAVVYILGKYAWPPLMRVLAEREQSIRESLQNAKREREEAGRVLEKYTQQIEQARTEASAIVDAGRRNAADVSQRIQEEARQEGAHLIERARREIRLATDAAKKDIYDLAAELAVDVAGRIIRKELSGHDHRALVEESLARMRAEVGNTK